MAEMDSLADLLRDCTRDDDNSEDNNTAGSKADERLRFSITHDGAHKRLVHTAMKPKEVFASLPVDLPPSAALSPEFIRAQITDEYLLNLEALSVHDPTKSQRYWKPDLSPENLFLPVISDSQYSLTVERDPITFEAKDFHEATCGIAESAVSSMSLTRALNADADKVHGSTLQYPFQPAGMGLTSSKLANNARPKRKTNTAQDNASVSAMFSTDVVLPEFGPIAESLPQAGDLSELSICDIDELVASLALPAATLDEQAAGRVPAPEAEAKKAESAAPASPEADLPRLEDLAVATSPTPSAAETEQEQAELEDALKKIPAQQPANSKKKSDDDVKHWAIALSATQPVDDFEFQVPNPAWTWPFELDIFQKQAIICMERHESVFVAAHTSAGKTVVAEYAIAMSQKHMTRCIYTSPIKALSNQKFRDFRERFEDVGLLTGDVQIKPNASCLIMTTEILRSMLYRGADLIRDVEWVIFDEVHYINNAERGVVWEETIIMLPKHVNVVLLSATVPNTFEFADWVGRTRRQRVYVISTSKRPVPLEHFIFTGNDAKTSDRLYKIVDASGRFLQQNHAEAVRALKDPEGKKGGPQGFGGRNRQYGFQNGDKARYCALVRMLQKKQLQPCVVFTFSKKRCDQNAFNIRSFDFNTAEERGKVDSFFMRCISILRGQDRELPQIVRIREMVQRGIGVHHSGLLPIMKELVEMLFAQGLIKVLFATETFAMGVNMPAKCVVFDAIRKHDGENFRDLLPGEYVQMAGRAGRRGLDVTGTVIVLCKGEVPDVNSLHTVMLGKPTTLSSRFRLTYNMILNLLRVEDLRVEDMMRQSFSEIDLQRESSDNIRALEEGRARLELLASEQLSEDLEEYYNLSVEFLEASHRMLAEILASSSAVRAMGNEGRIIVINNQTYRNSLAIILRAVKQTTVSITAAAAQTQEFEVLVMTDAAKNKRHADAGFAELPLPVTHLNVPTGAVGYQATKINGMDIVMITKSKLNTKKTGALSTKDVRSMLAQQLLELAKQGLEALEYVHPTKDLGLRSFQAADAYARMEDLLGQLRSFECMNEPDFIEKYGRLHQRKVLMSQVESLQHQLSDMNLTLLPEYEQRIEVMQQLQFISRDKIVQLKGRVACEISTCDELLVTELIFNDVFTPMEPEEVVALLSAMVFQDKRASEPRLTRRLEEGVDTIKAMATKIALTQLDCGMAISVEEYLSELRFGLVEVVYEWARGMAFKQITELTDVAEGSIVRCIVRLDEACRDVKNAARVIGDPVLAQKMEKASQMIKRDIVFAASLYTVE
eukprot:m.111284 g.111284  ORF g.111284 m.111284 type:complete len:1291 (-) comp15289_c0_seq2:139-4011(-)